MKKEIKDYLNFYLGCEIDINGQKEVLDSISQTGEIESLFRGNLRNYRHLSDEHIKPILRPLSDMNKEEKARWRLMVNSYQSYASTVKYFLDKHFDLFGLIESGLAIDATTINNP